VLASNKGGVELFRETAQKFVVGAPVIANGTYRLINRNSGMALHATGTALGSLVEQRRVSNNSSNQKWVVTNIGGNQFYLTNVANPRYLDVYGVSYDNGADISCWDFTAKDNQKWIIQSIGGGYYTLAAAHSGKLLDVYGASKTSGAKVVQWDANGGANQQWSFQAP
jgi:hypothetical protein